VWRGGSEGVGGDSVHCNIYWLTTHSVAHHVVQCHWLGIDVILTQDASFSSRNMQLLSTAYVMCSHV